ncbi:hypothetical protein MXB_5200 [Myxobolus squamalis]|nr:hypothetical protein MXB_5200 [Myxobolus squamalis]
MYKKLLITRSKFQVVNDDLKTYLITKRKFPDYPEVRKVIIESNKKHELGMSTQLVNFESFELFNEVSSQLQMQRKQSVATNMALLINSSDLEKLNDDPAEKNASLSQKLTVFSEKHKDDLEKVFRNYVDIDLAQASQNLANSNLENASMDTDDENSLDDTHDTESTDSYHQLENTPSV